ncbi:Uncharacterised protein [Yersinia enterocolitica]|uniref:hypothetical protein n=1 Tax=Yersinia enterocolitica TaxID=630 RepID=UPI0005E219B5|nr:hypothetical protein [Yersinia enterocolitica]CNG24631.1 Uncharacterised protein [Yersinia enterocolitica]
MNVKMPAPVMRRMSQAPAQKVTTREINILKTQLTNIQNRNNGGFATANTKDLNTLYTKTVNAQTRLDSQKTSIFANKKGQLASLLKGIESTAKKNASPLNKSTVQTSHYQDRLQKKIDRHSNDLGNTPGLGLNSNNNDHLQFNN